MTVATKRNFGHLALHYMPGDEAPARRLLEILGATLVDNGPDPGNDGFCTVLLDGDTANHAENIFFLSNVKGPQLAIEEELRSRYRGAASVAAYDEALVNAPESISHIGLRYRSFDELEGVLLALEAAAAPGGELEGRISITRYKARPGLDAELDARIGQSPAFKGDERPAFANHWIQCFVRTDVCGYGILAFGQTFELDYVADGFFAEPPSFGRPKAKAS